MKAGDYGELETGRAALALVVHSLMRHLGGFFGGFRQRVEHLHGVDVLAGVGTAEFVRFGMFCVFCFFTEN
jgi:hypothetical protein